jgi:hypothetical protein
MPVPDADRQKKWPEADPATYMVRGQEKAGPGHDNLSRTLVFTCEALLYTFPTHSSAL